MAEYMNMNLLKFLLFDVVGVEDILSFKKHQEYDEEGLSLMLDSIKDIADLEMYPYLREFDETPARYVDGQVQIHKQLGKILSVFAENGWIGTHFSTEHGGMNAPFLFEAAASHIFLAANNHAAGYAALTTGAANLITTFGSEDQIQDYVPNMVSGKWMGTMSLTEPGAGSSLGDLSTMAVPTSEGHYLITGQKIFISGGDHQFAENFVHMVIARIKGAPEGSKGISLFIVPKFRMDLDGSLVPNDVITAGDYQKLGQRGYCTTHLMFGENDDCRGYLVGEENQGLKYMFQMMNQARLEVGMIASSVATAAYQASLQYARERAQGRRMTKEAYKAPEQSLIIDHPDVRRMLLFQKAIAEGSLALLLQTYRYYDLSKNTEGEVQQRNQWMLDLLTPIAKSYPADQGTLAVSQGLQVLGGYGYTRDFLLELYYRDIRITSIYEGTSGIQAQDLLGRKATAGNGQAMMIMMEEMNQTIEEALKTEELAPYGEKLREAIMEVQKVMEHLLPFAFNKEYERFLADASLFMEFTGHIVISWQWLKMAVKAAEILAGGDMNYPESFYKSRIHTMKYYFIYELPKIRSLSESIRSKEELTIRDGKEFAFD